MTQNFEELEKEIMADFENNFASYKKNPQFKEEMTEDAVILSQRSNSLRSFLSTSLLKAYEEGKKEERQKVVDLFNSLPREFWEDQDHAVGGYISKKELHEILKKLEQL